MVISGSALYRVSRARRSRFEVSTTFAFRLKFLTQFRRQDAHSTAHDEQALARCLKQLTGKRLAL